MFCADPRKSRRRGGSISGAVTAFFCIFDLLSRAGFYRAIPGLVVVALYFFGFQIRAETPGDTGAEVDEMVRVGLPLSTMNGMEPADARLVVDRIFKEAWLGVASFRSKFYEDNDKFYQGIIDREVDLAPMLIGDYLRRSDECRIEPVMQGVTDDAGSGTELILLARNCFDLQSLKGKKLLVDQTQQLTNEWLDLALAENGLPTVARHFAVVGEHGDTEDVVLRTLFGQTDSCLTSKQGFDLMVELNPQLKERLNIVAKSEPFAMHVICVASDFDKKRLSRLVAGLRELHSKPTGGQLLKLTNFNRIDYCETALVDAAASIQQRWKILRQRRRSEWLETQKQLSASKNSAPESLPDEAKSPGSAATITERGRQLRSEL